MECFVWQTDLTCSLALLLLSVKVGVVSGEERCLVQSPQRLSLSLSLDEKGIQLKNVPLTSLKAADASLQCNCLILSKR